jgi:hypothetical protein
LKKHEELVDATQRLADASVIAIAQLLAVWMYRDAWRASTTTATALGIVTFMLAGEFGGLYRPWRTESLAREARDLLVAWASVPFGLAAFTFVTKTSTSYSRGPSCSRSCAQWYATPSAICAPPA